MITMKCFFESTDYESFMRNVISLNCDTDTFGAIAGGDKDVPDAGSGCVQ